MPNEYKLVQKIVNKISLNNDLGDRPISISIRAGELGNEKASSAFENHC